MYKALGSRTRGPRGEGSVTSTRVYVLRALGLGARGLGLRGARDWPPFNVEARMRIRPMFSDQPFLPAKAVVLSQLPHQTHRRRLRERGLIHSFPSNVKGKSPCKQAERNTKNAFHKNFHVRGTARTSHFITPGH